MTEEVNFWYPKTQKFINDFNNPDKCVGFPIVNGHCPGVRDLLISQFPPRNMETIGIPVTFEFWLTKINAYTIEIMVEAIDVMNSNMINVLGIVHHKQREELQKICKRSIDTDLFEVGIKYSPYLRQGHIIFYKGLYAFIVDALWCDISNEI